MECRPAPTQVRESKALRFCGILNECRAADVQVHVQGLSYHWIHPLDHASTVFYGVPMR